MNAPNGPKALRLWSRCTAGRGLMSLPIPLLFFGLFADNFQEVAFGYAMGHVVCFSIGLACIYRATIGKKGEGRTCSTTQES